MEKSNPRSYTIKLILWFIAIVEALVFLLAIINGYSCGYKNSFLVHGVLGAIIGCCLGATLIVLLACNYLLGVIKKRKSQKS